MISGIKQDIVEFKMHGDKPLTFGVYPNERGLSELCFKFDDKFAGVSDMLVNGNNANVKELIDTCTVKEYKHGGMCYYKTATVNIGIQTIKISVRHLNECNLTVINYSIDINYPHRDEPYCSVNNHVYLIINDDIVFAPQRFSLVKMSGVMR